MLKLQTSLVSGSVSQSTTGSSYMSLHSQNKVTCSFTLTIKVIRLSYENLFTFPCILYWLGCVVLRIYVSVTVFQSYTGYLEAGLSLKPLAVLAKSLTTTPLLLFLANLSLKLKGVS